MTHDAPRPSDPDRFQKKADILESNLYNGVLKEENPFEARFRINRETTPDPVLIKALIQVLPRLNIKATKIILFIRQLLNRPLDKAGEIKVQKKLLDMAGCGDPGLDHLSVTLGAKLTPGRLILIIKGVAPVPGKDGEIAKAFFDYKSCPGLIRADGAIDFREINKYPIVKTGDNLFFIAPEIQGRSGMQYDGKVAPVDQAMPVSFDLGKGVDRKESLDSQGKSRGYFLRANRTGVVVLTRTGEKISRVEVRDDLDVSRLDYSTGNIGTRFTCPISMTIDTICNGFKIRARGTVRVKELEGGEIETDSHAEIHAAHPGSKVRAQKDITVRFSKNALLATPEGRITIMDELVDSTVTGPAISFEKYRGILSGSTLDGEILSLKNLFFNGETRIYFGRRLFREQADLIRTRGRLKEEAAERKETRDRIMAELQNAIRQLSGTLKPHPGLRLHLRTFILAAREMDFSILYRELDTMARTMNLREITGIRKKLNQLETIPKRDLESQARDNAVMARIAEIQNEMPDMRLVIDGFLRRASTLKVFIPTAEKTDANGPEPPALFLESKTEGDTRVKIEGSFTPGKGFQIIRL